MAATPAAEPLVPGEGSPVPRAGSWPSDPGGTWVIDLDGVVWLTGEPIAGVPEALAQLGQAGIRTLFATNNSAPTVAELQERLARAGVDVRPEDLITSAQAAAGMVEPGSTVLALADGGVLEALDERGVVVVEAGPADAVIVGWTHRFDFDRLAQAATAVRDGARLIGTNEDPTHPTPKGSCPAPGPSWRRWPPRRGLIQRSPGNPTSPWLAW